MSSNSVWCALVTCLLWSSSVSASAEPYEVHRIARTGDPEPSGGTFRDFSPPTYHNEMAVFRATNSSDYPGIYGYSGSIFQVARFFETAPDGGIFTNFGEGPDFHDGIVAFQASGTRDFLYGPAFEGIYVRTSGSTIMLANTSTPVPEGVGNFTAFGQTVRFRLNVILFRGTSSTRHGLYIINPGSTRRLADTTQMMPGHTENFAVFRGFDLVDTAAVFVGESASGFRGIYISNSIITQKVVDQNTPRPDGGGAFGTLGTQIAFKDGRLVFTSGVGVYTFYDGTVVKIADAKTNPPLGNDQFNNLIGSPEIEGNASVFSASTPTRQGLYIGNGHNLWTVFDNTSPFDSRNIQSFQLSNESLSSGTMTFKCNFTDSTKAIYAIRTIGVPVGSWLRTTQRLRLQGAGGFQVMRYNFSLGTSSVTPYADAPNLAEMPLARGQWLGLFVYDYWSGRFTEATYRNAVTGL